MATAKHPSFAALLKRCRRDASLTQEELGERAGLSARAISDLERGINRRPYRSTVERLMEALQLPARERSLFELVARGQAAPPPLVASPGAPGPPLVGREAELEELERHLGSGHQPVLMLAGEPGIGKTRLLQEAAQRGMILGYTVLQGACQRRSGQEPYSPVLEALASYIGQQSGDDRRAVLDGCSWLVRLLPELGQTIEAPSGTFAAQHERRLMFAAVARFLGNIAGSMGTLLLLDDLHWAGGDVFALLSSLLSLDSETPLHTVGAYRHTEVDARHPLFVALADLSRTHLVRQRDLGPLSEESASALLGSILAGQERRSPDLERRIVQRTGGVPFYLVSYAYSLRARTSAAGDNLPWDVTQNLRQRVGALPAAAQGILGVAAVIGRVVPHRLLIDSAGRDEEQVCAALDATSRAGLLVEDGRLDHRFVHDVIREVIEADLGAGRRGALHRRVGEALERLSASTAEEKAAELAWHFLEGDDPERALPYVLLAGDQAETVFAHEEAEWHYRTALRVAQEIGNKDGEAEALEKVGRLLTATGRYDEALQILEQALRMYGMVGNLHGETRAAAEIGWTHAERGTPREGLEQIRPLTARLETHERSPHLADLYLSLARLVWDSGSPSEALTVADRASELGRALGDDRILVRASYWRGLALWQMGRLEDESRTWDELGVISEAPGKPDRMADRLVDAVPPLVRISRGEVRESRRRLEQDLQLARLRGDPGAIAWNLSLLGFCALMMCDWSHARVCMEEALKITRSLGSSFHIAPLMDMGLLSLFEGDWQAAACYLQEAADRAERKGDLFAQRVTAERLARLDVLEGRPEVAVERLTPLLDRPGLEGFRVAVILSTLSWAYLERGDLAQAETLVADAVRREAAQENHLDLAYARFIQAKVLRDLGRWTEAEQSVEQALSLYRSTPSPYHEALTLHDYGLLNAERGEPGIAQQQLGQARAIFTRLGAKKDLERTEQALAALDSTAV